MKTINRMITKKMMRTLVLLSFSFVFFTACDKAERGSVNNSEGQPKSFASSGEAVQQGKKDLTELLRIRNDLKLEVDAALVSKSLPEQGLEVFEVDFKKLLQADGVTGLEQVAGAEKGNTTPLSYDNQVVGIIDTRKDADGWRVSAISNQTVKKDLNEIRKLHADLMKRKMSYFEVPNIQARIYSVSIDGQNQYVTNYDGFTFDKPVSISELLPKLREDAQAFEKIYGEALRSQRLVR